MAAASSNQVYQMHLAKRAQHTPSIAQHRPEDGPSWPHHSLKFGGDLVEEIRIDLA